MRALCASWEIFRKICEKGGFASSRAGEGNPVRALCVKAPSASACVWFPFPRGKGLGVRSLGIVEGGGVLKVVEN